MELSELQLVLGLQSLRVDPREATRTQELLAFVHLDPQEKQCHAAER